MNVVGIPKEMLGRCDGELCRIVGVMLIKRGKTSQNSLETGFVLKRYWFMVIGHLDIHLTCSTIIISAHRKIHKMCVRARVKVN